MNDYVGGVDLWWVAEKCRKADCVQPLRSFPWRVMPCGEDSNRVWNWFGEATFHFKPETTAGQAIAAFIWAQAWIHAPRTASRYWPNGKYPLRMRPLALAFGVDKIRNRKADAAYLAIARRLEKRGYNRSNADGDPLEMAWEMYALWIRETGSEKARVNLDRLLESAKARSKPPPWRA